MAHLSQDASLLEAFAQARTCIGNGGGNLRRAAEAVSSEQRRYAKVINFGLIYGMSAFGLAQQLGIERSAAQHYMERYFARYPGVPRYMERTREQAREPGLRRDGIRPPAVAAGDPELAIRRGAAAPSVPRSTRRCRAPRPISSSWR